MRSLKDEKLSCVVGKSGLKCEVVGPGPSGGPGPEPAAAVAAARPEVLVHKAPSLLCALPLLADATGIDCRDSDAQLSGYQALRAQVCDLDLNPKP